MIIKKYENKIDITKDLYLKYNLDKYVFFDIETTGFSRDAHCVFLVSCGKFESFDKFITTQFFSENLDDEYNTLNAFNEYIKPYDTWCSFNGIVFDEPFLIKRLGINNINHSLPSIHFDLYREIKPFKVPLNLTSCSLKSIEKYLNIQRKDEIDGAISVVLYEKYLMNKDPLLSDILMLHNYEDVINLPLLWPLIDKIGKENLTRDDLITEKQKSYLNFLIKKHKINLDFDVDKLLKSEASKIIDRILKGSQP